MDLLEGFKENIRNLKTEILHYLQNCIIYEWTKCKLGFFKRIQIVSFKQR